MDMISIAMSGVRAARQSLYEVANNTANVATRGYSRRAVMLSTSSSGGVATSETLRFNDGYKTQQLWQSSNALGHARAAQSYLDRLETIMGGNALDGTLKHSDLGIGAFFGALRSASATPADPVLREAVCTRADAMSKQFNNLRASLEAQLHGIDRQRAGTVDQINGLAKQVAVLNGQISASVAGGKDAAALMDQRDTAVGAMAAYAGVHTVLKADGSVDVLIGDGQPLVLGGQAGQIDIAHDASGNQALALKIGSQSTVFGATALGGELGGLESVEQNVLRPQLDWLSTLAAKTADVVNAQLAKGYDLHGNAGKPLFAFDKSTGRISLSPDVQSETLAFSKSATSPGNNENLLALIDRDSTRINLNGLGTVSIGSAFVSMLGRVGTASQQNKSELETAKAVQSQAEADWRSLSGVSKDEEAMNTVRFRDMYSANMKVISIAAKLFETTLNAI
ncbi:flagellar hook-associated protein FlgK [Pandoraea apista]|uniref:flagellar hook-associated protein FlgK n=1 Tax=Pandoraea apista TaxID=93218 RepID=UPI000F67B5D1|nr:flagellar hook-associated protein FlgK [Pandoraea apista]RRW88819.1 flagellar hook-associated protein FlgK [Pandoraea apista]RRW98078.1 flagellar hook-associated protein FlgK [Pandoraea apista]